VLVAAIVDPAIVVRAVPVVVIVVEPPRRAGPEIAVPVAAIVPVTGTMIIPVSVTAILPVFVATIDARRRPPVFIVAQMPARVVLSAHSAALLSIPAAWFSHPAARLSITAAWFFHPAARVLLGRPAAAATVGERGVG
jgi:hypothetical protein